MIDARKETLGSALGAAIIAAAALVAFWPALHGGWIWDDTLYLAHNADLAKAGGLLAIWFHPANVNYFPVTFSLWWAGWHLWGDSTTGFHWLNLFLHFSACLLLWRFIRELGFRGGWLAGLLFAVHPVVVESVAWISETKNTLSLVLLLLSLISYRRWLRFSTSAADVPEPGSRCRAYVVSLLCFLLAMLAKSTIVLTPIWLLALTARFPRTTGSRRWWATVPFFVVSIGLGLLTVWFEKHRAMIPDAGNGSGQGAGPLQVATSFGFYVWKALIPSGLCPSYPLHANAVQQWIEWVGLLAFLFAVAAVGWRESFSFKSRLSECLLPLGWFALLLIPTLGILPMAYLRIAPVADHFAYAALPGMLTLAAVALGEHWFTFNPNTRRMSATLLAAIVMLLMMTSRSSASWYRDERIFWKAVIEQNRTSWLGFNHLGAEELRSGDAAAALNHFQAAVRLNPHYVEAINNLGLALEALGQNQAAIPQFETALCIRPEYWEARKNLAALHSRLGAEWMAAHEYFAAIDEFQASIAADAHNPLFETNLGLALAHSGRTADAMTHYRKALALDPDSLQAHVDLGNALARSGEIEEATAQYREALRIAPDYAPARDNLRTLENLFQPGRR